MTDTDKFLKEIENVREKMSSTALSKGITSPESILLSQELDRLLNIYDYQKKLENNKVKNDE